MSPVAKKRPPSDEQLMEWARAYYKAAAGGEDWGRPPRFSQLAKIVDAMIEELEHVRQAMRDPMRPGAAKVIFEAQLNLEHGAEWEDDDGHLVCDADVEYYADAIEWARHGAKASDLRLYQRQYKERMRAIKSGAPLSPLGPFQTAAASKRRAVSK